MMDEYQNVNKEYKLLSVSRDKLLWSQPLQTVSRLNIHVTVHIQSKVIIWSCGKTTCGTNSLSLSLLSRVSPGLLISG